MFALKLVKANRAARFTMSDYSRFSSVSSMKSQLNWDLLQSQREKAKATMMYKIHHHLIDIQAPTLLIPLVTITRGHNLRYQQIRCRLDLYKYSFFPSSVQLWNGLPVAVAEATSLDAFKHGLSSVSLMKWPASILLARLHQCTALFSFFVLLRTFDEFPTYIFLRCDTPLEEDTSTADTNTDCKL